MIIYAIDNFTVVAYEQLPADLAASALIVRSHDDLAAFQLTPAQRLQLWRGIPGATALKRPPSLDRIWQAMLALRTEPVPATTPTLSPSADSALAEVEAVAPSTATTRQAAVIALLRRPAGATLIEIMTLTGWQKHSVRGFISGAAKKKLGLAVESTKVDGDRTYRIVEGA